MEQLLIQLLSGTLTTETLLVLLILGFIFKRIVPWWVYDDVVQELKKYEDDAPQIMEAVEDLIELVKEDRTSTKAVEQANKVHEQTQSIRARHPRPQGEAGSVRKRRDGAYHSAHRRGDASDE